MSKVAPSPIRSGWPRLVVIGGILALAVVGLTVMFWPSPDPEVIWTRASQEFMARRFDRAEADLDRVLRLRKPTPSDWFLQAQLFMTKGKIDEAIEALAKVPDGHPMATQARMEEGQLELRRFRYRFAEAAFLKALKIDPKMLKPRRELVYLYGMQLRRPELNATFRVLSEISPLIYSEVFLWCLTRGVTWEAKEIVETMEKCIAADPDDRWGRLALAEALRQMSRFDEAEKALKPLPDSDSVARATRVRLALDRGDDQTADSLLSGGPADNIDLALLRGRFALARGDGPEAARQFRIAHNKAPNLREAVLGLGQALKSVGDPGAGPLLEEAQKHERLGSLIQRAAVEKNRDDPALMRDLGAACAAIGRYPEARAWYNLAITKDPLDTAAQQGLARVKEAEARANDPAG